MIFEAPFLGFTRDAGWIPPANNTGVQILALLPTQLLDEQQAHGTAQTTPLFDKTPCYY
jgi:hypothetical protein